MKAKEVLKRYNEGRRDFQGESLRGESFKKANLAGADFSEADIRGASFAYANLSGAKFCGAKAGLQRRWAIGLVIGLLVLSLPPIYFSIILMVSIRFSLDISFIDKLNPPQNVIVVRASVLSLLTGVIVFSIVTIRKDIGAGFGALARLGAAAGAVFGAVVAAIQGVALSSLTVVVLAVVLIVLGIFAGVITFISVGTMFASLIVSVGVVVAGLRAVAGLSAVTVSVLLAFPVLFLFLRTGELLITVSVALAGSVAFLLVSAYLGSRTLAGDSRDAWMRSLAIIFAATGGTSFYNANLTDTDFTNATLKSTDLRKATLTRTSWRDTIKLDRIRPGETYLKDPRIRQLLITGNGEGQNFDHLLNLKGIKLQNANLIKANFTGSDLSHANLQSANLADASLIGTNLNAANLQEADLSRAKLVQAQLDNTDLTGATLTGAYIEDWNITTETILNGVRCDYIFMRLPEGTDDPNSHRKPDDWYKNFADGDFIDFITPMVQTLDLYHNKAVDPRLVAIAFHNLTEKHPDAELEIISIEKKGNNRDKLHIKAETSPQANPSLLHGDYFANLDELQSLPPAALEALLAERGAVIRMLVGLLETKHNSPEVSINNNPIQGNTNMSGDRTINTSGGNYNEREINLNDQASYAERDYYHNSQQQQTLAEAAAEIQQLLEQLSQTYPTDTTTGKMAVATAAIEQIDNNPTLTNRILSALKAGSIEAFAQALNHPAASFVIGALSDWQKGKES